ncbi:MAG: hypothetical protein PVJ64_10605 [Gemmatimonadales bacterium]
MDVDTLRCEIRNEYANVAHNPQKGFHFHTGRRLAKILGYSEALLERHEADERQGPNHEEEERS